MRAALKLVMYLSLGTIPLWAQRLPTRADTSTVQRHIAQVRDVPIVFAGRLASIVRDGEAVVLTFQVSKGIRGVAEDQIVVREWRGIWLEQSDRFTAGQQGYFFVRPGAEQGFGRVEASFTITADGEVIIQPAAASLTSRAHRLRESAKPVTISEEGFSEMLRKALQAKR